MVAGLESFFQETLNIVIETVDNERGFVAGEVIRGFVHVNQKQHFTAKHLIIGLFGQESYSFKKSNTSHS